MKTTRKTGPVVAILSVKEDTDLIIISQNGKIIRIESATIRQAGPLHAGREAGERWRKATRSRRRRIIPETPENGNGNGQEIAARCNTELE